MSSYVGIVGNRISVVNGRAVRRSGTMSTVRAHYYLRRHVCTGRGAAATRVTSARESWRKFVNTVGLAPGRLLHRSATVGHAQSVSTRSNIELHTSINIWMKMIMYHPPDRDNRFDSYLRIEDRWITITTTIITKCVECARCYRWEHRLCNIRAMWERMNSCRGNVSRSRPLVASVRGVRRRWLMADR